MPVQPILQELESLGNPTMRKHHIKYGATGILFGVKMGDIRKIAKRIGVELTTCHLNSRTMGSLP